jgi:hypothetical protein
LRNGVQRCIETKEFDRIKKSRIVLINKKEFGAFNIRRHKIRREMP